MTEHKQKKHGEYNVGDEVLVRMRINKIRDEDGLSYRLLDPDSDPNDDFYFWTATQDQIFSHAITKSFGEFCYQVFKKWEDSKLSDGDIIIKDGRSVRVKLEEVE